MCGSTSPDDCKTGTQSAGRIFGPAGGQGAAPAPKTPRRASVAPTLADLRGLWDGRDRLLKVAEVAKHLGVCNATVYRLCERAELPFVWIGNSMRIRPDDLRAFLDRQTVGRREP
jgi:excisionase family DNA binding protein